MGISVPLHQRGIHIDQSDPVVRRLHFEEPTVINYPQTPDPKTRARFKQLLPNRSRSKPSKSKVDLPQFNLRSYPNGIKPILVARAGPPPLGPTAKLFAEKESGAKSVNQVSRTTANRACINLDHVALPPVPREKHNHLNRHATESDGESCHFVSVDITPASPSVSKPSISSIAKRPAQASRKSHPLIDNSAIESDGEGGDIASNDTTPESSTLFESNILKVKPPILKPKTHVPKVICEHCGTVTSSDYQLKKHQAGKKCRRKRARKDLPNTDLVCPNCRKSFASLHNFHNHKC